MSITEYPEQQLNDFFSKQLFAILSTRGDKGQHMVIVSFIATKQLNEIIFVTPRQTRKFENIRKNSQVSLYIDNRSNDIRDLQNLTGIEVKGNASEVSEDNIDQYLEFYLAKYPDLYDFARSPSSAFVKVEVSQYEIINHFQNVTVLEVKP